MSSHQIARRGTAPPRVSEPSGAFGDAGRDRSPGASDEWAATLAALRVRYVVLDCHRDRDLLEAIGRDPGWRLEYQDGDAVLYARSGSPTEETD